MTFFHGTLPDKKQSRQRSNALVVFHLRKRSLDWYAKHSKNRMNRVCLTAAVQEERKETLGAQVKQAKRHRTKSRKARMNASPATSSSDNKVEKVRKSVTFA